MIPYEYRVLGNQLLNNSRAIALSSLYEYGKPINDEHLLDKLDSYLETFKNNNIGHKLDTYKASMEYPYLGETEYRRPIPPSDTILYDCHRQHHSILERLEKNRLPDEYFRLLEDPATRVHLSFARGAERRLINYFNKLDSEAIHRNKHLKTI